LGRESHAPPGIGMGIALPHGDPCYIRQSSISCLTFRQPVKWRNEPVSLVFLWAVKKEKLKNADTKQFFVFMNQLMKSPLFYEKLLKEQDRLKFLSYFKMEEY
jgi:activator of the mannose operon (transcriptional antiterminator)